MWLAAQKYIISKRLKFEAIFRPLHTSMISCSTKNRRINSLGVQMLSKPLHKQIFGDKKPSWSSRAIAQSKKHLIEQGLWGKEGTIHPDIDLQLPPLQGKNIDEHFRTIASELSEPYLQLALDISQATLPPMPDDWNFSSGWTRYDADGNSVSVEMPSDQALVFDVEVCVRDSPCPVLAIAVGTNGWYSWVSERLTCSENFFASVDATSTVEELITMGEVEEQERLIIGHNVSYDRARIREQYNIQTSATKFLDTLSLHACVAGQTTLQKILWQAALKDPDQWQSWMDISSPNSLSHAHWCHVTRGRRRVNKEQRSVFVKGSIQDIRNQFQECMQYCAKDVFHTHELLVKLLPQFLERYPHPVTFAGMLEMGTAYLPVNSNWEQYIANAEYTYEELEREMKCKLMALADEACSHMHNQRYFKSVWLCNLDWSAKAFKGKSLKTKRARTQLMKNIADRLDKQGEEEKFEFVISSSELSAPGRQLVHMPGYPEWYRGLCMRRNDPHWRPGAVNISAQTRITPYLLQMRWQGHPLHYHDKLGWGYIISMETKQVDETTNRPKKLLSFEEIMEVYNDEIEDLEGTEFGAECVANGNGKVTVEFEETSTGEWRAHCLATEWGVCNDVINLKNGEKYYYFKMPHKDGPQANCGNPLSKDYLSKMADGTLTSGAGQAGQRILTLNSMMSFWRSARTRIMQQFVVWQTNHHTAPTDSLDKVGAIIPQVIVAGTATRRAVESTWLTASNAKIDRVGSEQKAMIQAPPGYHLVGADVDSQELWIAALLGDVHFAGIHGCTGIGWMTLQGNKAEGTDVHSSTAKTIGISRDHAKILNYGRFYGAGKPFIELLLRKFNPSLTAFEVKEKAELLYSTTKGVRMYQLSKKGLREAREMDLPLVDDCLISHENWKLFCAVQGYHAANKMVSSRVWYGGSESHLFNKLESIALSDHPCTPVLSASLTRALQKEHVGNQFQPSRINWVVQSSAVDYLHLLLVSCQWMFRRYNITGRFCISIHDEVRYLVKTEDRYRAALALQYANIHTRAMFAHKLGLQDLPMSVAFFSGVDVDKVMRKEATLDCRTPSNPLGMEKGYDIQNGEVLNIYQLIDKTSGQLDKINNNQLKSFC